MRLAWATGGGWVLRGVGHRVDEKVEEEGAELRKMGQV
jgi:hypothetical protein